MKTCIITGASSGIGEALALEMARRGYAVGLVARRQEMLEALAEKIRSTGGKAEAAAADVTDAQALSAAIARLEGALGPCALMVANAGGNVGNGKVFEAGEYLETMKLNFDSVVHSISAVLPGMEARGGGQIVVVSSVASYRGLPRSGPYCASKAAVSALCESLRIDYASKNIRFTTIQPGYISTPLTAKSRFPMPFLMSAERAARRMANAIEAGTQVYSFPFRMKMLVTLGWLLPPWLWDRLMAGRKK